MEAKKKVTVLLTRYYSTFSNFVYWISGRGYTHVSIALNDENDCYYSFNFKGFRREYPGRKKNVAKVLALNWSFQKKAICR